MRPINKSDNLQFTTETIPGTLEKWNITMTCPTSQNMDAMQEW